MTRGQRYCHHGVRDGCKRVVRSSTFYPTLRREHVELVTEEIREVREHSVITADGGCRSWFLDHAGRNTTRWPWPTARLCHLTRHFDLDTYQTRHRVLSRSGS